MTEKKQTDIFQQRGKETLIWYNFKHELPIKLEAIRELQSEDVKLKELEKIHNEFAEYVTNWYELFGITNNPDITKVFKPTELLKEKGMNYFHEKRLEFPKMLYPIEREIEKLRFKKSIPKENEDQNPEIFLDYSDNTQAERIVFLHELGILEFLQSKMNKELHGSSANKLAEIVSTFTNIEQKTAQSYLNPMFTKDAIQKNNPITKTNLEKVRNKLKNIGFNTSKSV